MTQRPLIDDAFVRFCAVENFGKHHPAQADNEHLRESVRWLVEQGDVVVARLHTYYLLGKGQS